MSHLNVEFGQANKEDTIPNLVKIQNDKELDDSFYSSRGADCELTGARIIRDRTIGKGMQLVIGRRKFGRTYIDSESVAFTYYKLICDEEWDRYKFVPYKSMEAKKKYCDIDTAFKYELGI